MRAPTERAAIDLNATQLRISVKSTTPVPERRTVTGKALVKDYVDRGGTLRRAALHDLHGGFPGAFCGGSAAVPRGTREVVLEPLPTLLLDLFRGVGTALPAVKTEICSSSSSEYEHAHRTPY